MGSLCSPAQRYAAFERTDAVSLRGVTAVRDAYRCAAVPLRHGACVGSSVLLYRRWTMPRLLRPLARPPPRTTTPHALPQHPRGRFAARAAAPQLPGTTTIWVG